MLSERRAIEENPIDFVKRYKKSKKLLLFLDEIQRSTTIGESLKIIYDEFPDVKIIATVSSSLELKTNILPHLVGRTFLFELLPFDFEEFITAKEPSLLKIFKEKTLSVKKFLDGKSEIKKPSFQQEFLSLWKEFVIYGGYPEVVKTKDNEIKKKILRSIIELYLEKDIFSFFKIEQTSKFEDFAKHLSFNIGNLLNLSTISSDLKISLYKAENFLEILKHTFIVRTIPPFHKSLITELKKSQKLFFIDLGLRNALLNNFQSFENRTDQGRLAENFVFTELISNFKDCELKFWRTTGKAEVDFVLIKNNQPIPLEVKLNGRIGKSFYSFCNTYKPKKGLVITLDQFKKIKWKRTEIYFIPIFYL